jgi:hypothetical protein
MESAVVRVAVVAVDVRIEPVVACGRFSSGLESQPETAAKARVGRFSDGLERKQGAARWRVGRFSSGVERWPDAPAAARVGSFGDGYEQLGR